MGEGRSVIRDTRDSRCYVNISTTLPSSSAQPLCRAALTPRMNHAATSGFNALGGPWHAVRVWSVSFWTGRPTATSASLLLSALGLQQLHNRVFGSRHCLKGRPADSNESLQSKPFRSTVGESINDCSSWHIEASARNVLYRVVEFSNKSTQKRKKRAP